MNTDASHDYLFHAVERMTLEQAYEAKRVSLKQILTEWGFYIATNALGTYLTLLCMLLSVVIIYDCAAEVGLITGIVNALANYPMLVVAIFIAAFCPFVFCVGNNVMKRTIVEFGEV
jgi:formate/nitrite transporter FocA (FNT family)